MTFDLKKTNKQKNNNPWTFSTDIHKLRFDPAPCLTSALVTQQYYCNLMLIIMRYASLFPQGADSDHSKATDE